MGECRSQRSRKCSYFRARSRGSCTYQRTSSYVCETEREPISEMEGYSAEAIPSYSPRRDSSLLDFRLPPFIRAAGNAVAGKTVRSGTAEYGAGECDTPESDAVSAPARRPAAAHGTARGAISGYGRGSVGRPAPCGT